VIFATSLLERYQHFRIVSQST